MKTTILGPGLAGILTSWHLGHECPFGKRAEARQTPAGGTDGGARQPNQPGREFEAPATVRVSL